MSLDSQLDRSKLERKDRDELATIVTTLGGKPGRSKKSDLVEMILELTSGAGEESATRGRRSRAVDAEEATSGADARDSSGGDVSGGDPSDTNGSDYGGNGSDTAEGSYGTETRRRSRLVGWAGDEAGLPAPVEDPEPEVRQDVAAEAVAADTRTSRDARPDSRPARDDQEDGQDEGREEGRFDGDGNRRRRRRGRDRNRDRFEGGQQPQSDQQFDGEPVAVTGYLDLRDEGYGFLRMHGALQSRDDAYVSVRQVRQFGLRRGDHISGASRPAGRNEKNPALLRIDSVNGRPPEEATRRPRFEDLTPLFPDQKLRMEIADDPTNMTARILDLISPIGMGQRGMIVSPPKAGKTTIMKQIARAIEVNNPDVILFVLLVDERPEEVTDMRRWLQRGEVVASTFDRPSDEHTHVAELTIERAKRMVEYGKDVVIMLDGITRLARAYNLAAPATGRIMSGGIDTGALYPPKKFFGAARNVEEGGSLTILATALVETGSKMDEVIFEEFKGTGNMELRLDRRIAERRIYPAIDVASSSTRHEELLFERKQLQQVYKLRRVLSGLQQDGEGSGAAALELLIDRLKNFKTNDDFLAEVAKGPSIG
ncbi:MAG TPA: transcription termination factor Rho [Acidimicrobiales bacterium]|nr:transcription termination factor Rho [Acidimicrobiales bacterium]